MGRKGIARHRKRLAAPVCYPIPRKHGKFTYRSRPSPYPGNVSIPLGIIVRDIMGYAHTGREAKLILREGAFLVDGKVRKDPKFSVGPMMVISIPRINAFYRVTPTGGSRLLSLVPISSEDANWTLSRIDGKQTLKGAKTHLKLSGGRSILVSKDDPNLEDYSRRGTIKLSIPDQEILEHFPFEVGAPVVVNGGSNMGKTGTLKEFVQEIGRNKSLAVVETPDGEEVRTAMEYVFVLGRDEPAITISSPETTDTETTQTNE